MSRAVPRPWQFWLAGFLGLFGQFFIVYNRADNSTYPYPITMLLLIVWYLFRLWLILRWSGNGCAWDDRHRIAPLSLLLVLGLLTAGAQYPVMYWSHPVFLLLLWLAGRAIRRRVASATVP